MLDLLPAIVTGGAKLLGGLFSDNSAEKQRAHNEALQREFAQNSIQWRVADAKKAGVHPMYALGAPSMSPAVSISESGVGKAMGSMGQDISRAMFATQSQETRDTMFNKTLQDLQVQNFTLKNDLLASQIAKLKSMGNPPAPPNLGSEGLVSVPMKNKPEDLNLNVLGGTAVRGHPGFSSTNSMSDTYGDENPLIQWLYGPAKMYFDWAYHTSGAANLEQYRSMVEKSKRHLRARPMR